MATIAYARTFDGSDDRLHTVTTGIQYGTLAIILKRTTGDSGSFRTAASWGNDAAIYFDSFDQFLFWSGSARSPDPIMDHAVADGWGLFALTKGSGSATPRFHHYTYGTDTWEHDDGTTSIADWSGATDIKFGWSGSAGEYFSGLIACAGQWSAALSDVQLESMTATLASWEALSPDHLWLFDQDSILTDVTDRIGDSDQNALVGTTATAVADLDFDVGGYIFPTLRIVQSSLRWG